MGAGCSLWTMCILSIKREMRNGNPRHMFTIVSQPVMRELGNVKDRRDGGVVSDMLDGFEMSTNNIDDRVKYISHKHTVKEIARRMKKA